MRQNMQKNKEIKLGDRAIDILTNENKRFPILFALQRETVSYWKYPTHLRISWKIDNLAERV